MITQKSRALTCSWRMFTTAENSGRCMCAELVSAAALRVKMRQSEGCARISSHLRTGLVGFRMGLWPFWKTISGYRAASPTCWRIARCEESLPHTVQDYGFLRSALRQALLAPFRGQSAAIQDAARADGCC